MRTYVRKRTQHRLLEDVQELCRLCLQKRKENLTIFNDDSAVCPLALRIRMCVGLEISKEECLSNIICKECFQELERIYDYRKKCELSYRRLKSHLNAMKQSAIHNFTPRKRLVKYGFYGEDVDDNGLDGELEDTLIINSQENSTGNGENIQMYGQIDESKTNEKESEEQGLPLCEEAQDPPLPAHPEADSGAISSFLTDLLVKIGILVQQEDGTLLLAEGATNTVHLVMGDQSQITFEIGEDGEEQSEEVVVEETQQVEEDVISKYINLNENIVVETEPEKSKQKSNKSLECSKCGKCFSSRGMLNRHWRVHSGERPHACEHCARAFSTRASMVRHRLLHSERRPFACTECPKSFTQRENLAAHALQHRAAAARPRRLFHCPRCPKVFMHRSGLSRHSSTYRGKTRMECASCGGTYSDRGSLLKHIRDACPAGNNARAGNKQDG